MTTIDKNSKTLIWDWPVRAFHWLLLFCFLGSWITAESGIEWATTHQWFGYTTLGLILFRACWGLIGPRFSRFFNLSAGPGQSGRALQELKQDHATHLGHSAIGGWATLALITLVTVQATSGLFISDDIFNSGPYNSIVTQEQADTWAGFITPTLMCCSLLSDYTWSRSSGIGSAKTMTLYGR